MSDTPRTRRLLYGITGETGPVYQTYVLLEDYEALQRELAAVTREREEAVAEQLRLHEAIGKLQDEKEAYKDAANRRMEERDKAESKLAEAEKDARRWRWMRDNPSKLNYIGMANFYRWKEPYEMESAIDAAMEAELERLDRAAKA